MSTNNLMGINAYRGNASRNAKGRAGYNRLSSYCTNVGTDANGDQFVQYRNTVIVRWNAHGIELNTGGWATVTTKRKMNQASHQFGLGYSVSQRDHAWYVTTPQGNEVSFDGRVLLLDRAIALQQAAE